LSFDPRITPARPDLAAAHLRGKVAAERFVEGTEQEVVVGIAPLRKEPSHQAPLLTEALYGERVTIYETDEEGWAWGQLKSDSYVGWMPASALLAPQAEPTHRVSALRTLVFPGPSIKLPPTDALPLEARVAVVRQDDDLAVTATGGHIPARHLAPLHSKESDFVAVAERFVGTPYLWGGKSSVGIDCSGLVQVALSACGIACPRDSDMQEVTLGQPISLAGLQRGDLVFWKGHVAIALGRNSMIHANAFHMAVAIEPVAKV
jgi:cell wall-associated NlpC family hydrolase